MSKVSELKALAEMMRADGHARAAELVDRAAEDILLGSTERARERINTLVRASNRLASFAGAWQYAGMAHDVVSQ